MRGCLRAEGVGTRRSASWRDFGRQSRTFGASPSEPSPSAITSPCLPLPRPTGDVDLVLALNAGDVPPLLESIGWKHHRRMKQRWTADRFGADGRQVCVNVPRWVASESRSPHRLPFPHRRPNSRNHHRQLLHDLRRCHAPTARCRSPPGVACSVRRPSAIGPATASLTTTALAALAATSPVLKTLPSSSRAVRRRGWCGCGASGEAAGIRTMATRSQGLRRRQRR